MRHKHQLSKLSKTFSQGFTILELMVVMAIIGILAALSIVSFQSSQIKARDSERKSNLKQIGLALETYYNDKGQYPTNSVDYKMNACVSEATCDWGDQWVDENGTVYMVEIPADRTGGLTYFYESDGRSYQLYARLENDLDNEVPTSSGDPANYGISCGDYNCNYGVSSTNTTVVSGRTITAD